MTHENRITNQSVESMPIAKAGPPSVKGFLAVCWRCQCGHVQIAEGSHTHVENCKRCDKAATVEVREGRA